MESKDTITVTIMSPDAVLWQGSALWLSSANSEGVFDIMPDHARFMTFIEQQPIVVTTQKGVSQSFEFNNAVLFFHDNVAKVYVHQDEPTNEGH